MRLHPAIPYLLRVWPKLPQRAYSIWFEEGWKSLIERMVAIFHMPRVDDRSYVSWIWRYDRLTGKTRQTIRNEITGWGKNAPKITIIMPISDACWRLLHTTIRSLQAQLHLHWELCLSADVAPSANVHRRLRKLSRKEPRLRIDFLEATDALSLEHGEFVAQIDPGDVVPEHALYWIAREILAQPKADLIFSDEDNIDDNKRRFDPWFKSDWNPALMLTQNAVGRLAVFRRSLMEQVGGLRPALHIAEEYDLLLRFANVTSPDRIRHVPRILYHRARREAAASFDWEAGCRAIVEHLSTQSIPATVRPSGNREFQVEYLMQTRQPRVSILLPTSTNPSLLGPCLESLLGRTTYREFEVLLLVAETHEKRIQHGNVLRRITEDPRLRVLTYADRPFNYSSVNNWGAKHAGGEVLCFLNDDTEVITADWLEQLVARMFLPRVAVVGVMLYYPDNTIQHAGVILGLGGVAGHAYLGMRRGSRGYRGRAYLEQDVSCVTAACMAMRSEVFREFRGFDEGLAVAYNDVDLCIRIRQAGWRIIWTPMVEFFHHESASLGRHDVGERAEQYLHDFALMRRRWEPVLDADPFYNRNLSLESAQELAFPPREGGDQSVFRLG